MLAVFHIEDLPLTACTWEARCRTESEGKGFRGGKSPFTQRNKTERGWTVIQGQGPSSDSWSADSDEGFKENNWQRDIWQSQHHQRNNLVIYMFMGNIAQFKEIIVKPVLQQNVVVDKIPFFMDFFLYSHFFHF